MPGDTPSNQSHYSIVMQVLTIIILKSSTLCVLNLSERVTGLVLSSNRFVYPELRITILQLLYVNIP